MPGSTREKLALHFGQPLASGNCCTMRQVNMALRHISAWRAGGVRATPRTGISPHQPADPANPAQPGSTAQRLRSFISSRPSSRITFQLSLILLSAAATRGPVWETFQTGLARSPGTALIGRYKSVSTVSLISAQV